MHRLLTVVVLALVTVLSAKGEVSSKKKVVESVAVDSLTLLVQAGDSLMQQYFAVAGQLEENLKETNLCRTQVKIHLDEDTLEYFLTESIGNHHMIVNGDCPYTDEEIFAVGTELSIAVCKAYKEIPGLAEGSYDRDAIFRKLVKE